jgi:3',5'-cyclic AMP phosphodiesterase CpdA
MAVRIALCSDTHTWTIPEPVQLPDGGTMFLDCADGLLDSLVAAIDAENPDLAVHLGDLTCGGGFFSMPDAEFAAQETRLRHVYGSMRAEMLALPGNHDCPPGGGDWRLFESLWGLGSGMGKTVDVGPLRLVLVNAQGHTTSQINEARPEDPTYGWVSQEELARVDESLASAGGRHVVLMIHQLLKPWQGPRPWAEFFGVQNRGDVLDVLERHGNVSAVFQGHAHMYEVQTMPVGGRPCAFVVVPAVIEFPTAWLMLEANGAGLDVELRSLSPQAIPGGEQRNGDGQKWRSGRPEWQKFHVGWTDS